MECELTNPVDIHIRQKRGFSSFSSISIASGIILIASGIIPIASGIVSIASQFISIVLNSHSTWRLYHKRDNKAELQSQAMFFSVFSYSCIKQSNSKTLVKTFFKSVLLLSLLSVLFSSCGVMFGGSKYDAQITVKDHPNAKIFIYGNEMGRGTVEESFLRRDFLTVKVKEAGCDTLTKTYGRGFRTWNFVLSAVSWGPVGIVVDLATGAAFKPAYREDSTIKKLDFREYEFTIDYSGCPVKQ